MSDTILLCKDKRFTKIKNIVMSKIGFKLSANTDDKCHAIRCTHNSVSISQIYQSVYKIVIRNDKDVKNSQVKGYKYLIP